MSRHPYADLPDKHFWRRTVKAWRSEDPISLDTPKFEITQSTRIATLGSCFAQHIGRVLRERHYSFIDYEPAPSLLPVDQQAAYGYGLFSVRSGNVYTSRQLLQLLQRAFGEHHAEMVWETEGRFYDAYRPTIEPGGFASLDELIALRRSHERALKRMFRESEVLVFTMGLTELWLDQRDGTAYPLCPGTIAGHFDASIHGFRNQGFSEVLEDMESFIAGARRRNPDLRFLLTVSPVPLAATASRDHVVVATSYSKSVLRAVAGELCRRHDHVDYFPSYELVTSAGASEISFDADMRNVTAQGVQRVMSSFVATYRAPQGEDACPTSVSVDAGVEACEQRVEEENRIELATLCDETKLDAGPAS
ncbi:hypothetical protein C1M51_12185 [Methylibium sp. Pch-M]|uniref:GSCFA domain-containing protein n=1 Tax=Methylibium sp. Pch-M TaxID=2082386 RepID=UPI001011D6E2|nr:GSCFA domain-containing protein [Methylibium sp. Pch-M]QAZ40119.1 hypothetical protein C1M51_12185 [Methylibium sp. Pch-M]